MVHVDAPDGEGSGHTQGILAGSIEEDTSTQHIIVGQEAMHISEHHVAHIDIILIQVHTVQQHPLARELALPQQLPLGILGAVWAKLVRINSL